MFCGKCGNKIPDGCAFCPYCGEHVALTATESSRGTQNSSSEANLNTLKKKKKHGGAFAVVAIISVFILLLGAVGAWYLVSHRNSNMYVCKTVTENYSEGSYLNTYSVEYDENQLVVKSSYQSGSDKRYRTLAFDDDGRLSDIIVMLNNNETVFTFEYSKQSSGEYKGVSNASNDCYYESLYENNDKLVKLSAYDSENGTVLAEDIWTYHSNGMVSSHKTVTYSQLSGDEVTELTYDKNGQQISQKNYRNSTLYYSFLFENNLTTESYTVDSYSDSDGITSYTNTKYIFGFPMEYETFDGNGNIKSHLRVSEQRNDYVKSVGIDSYGDRIESEIFIEDGRVTKCKSYTNGELDASVSITYDKDGNPVTTETYDESGKIVSKTEQTWQKRSK